MHASSRPVTRRTIFPGAGIAGEGSAGVTIAFTFKRTTGSAEDLNRTPAERTSKACERIEVISEAIEVLYAFASESEPSKVRLPTATFQQLSVFSFVCKCN